MKDRLINSLLDSFKTKMETSKLNSIDDSIPAQAKDSLPL